MQAHRQMAMTLIEETAYPLQMADRRHGYPLGAPCKSPLRSEDSQGFHHLVEIIEWLAHTHKDQIGKVVGPVKGLRGVYVFAVTDKTVSEQPFDAQTETQKLQQNYNYLINSRLMDVLRDKADIKNTMIRFF